MYPPCRLIIPKDEAHDSSESGKQIDMSRGDEGGQSSTMRSAVEFT